MIAPITEGYRMAFEEPLSRYYSFTHATVREVDPITRKLLLRLASLILMRRF